MKEVRGISQSIKSPWKFMQDEMISRLAELVRVESPSRDKPALDALATLLGGLLA